ncbi:MAG: ABC transporter ATP-binding protein [Actinomycetota bacterium]
MPDAARRATARRSLRSLRPHRRRVLALLGCTALQSLLSLAPALIIRSLVDDLQHPHQAFVNALGLLAAGAGLVLAGGVAGLLRTWLALGVTTSVAAEVRQQLADRLLDQSISFYTEARGGDLMSRALNDVAAAQTMLDTLPSFIVTAVSGAGAVVVMFVLEWRLALVTLLLVPVTALVLRRASRPIYHRRMAVQTQLGSLTAHLQENLSLSGMMLIKSFGHVAAERRRIGELNEAVRRSQIDAGMTSGWTGLFLGFCQFASPALLLLAGVWLLTHHYLGLGTLAAFGALGIEFGSALYGAGTSAVNMIATLPAWARLYEVIDHPAVIRDGRDALRLVEPHGHVELDRVTFAYPGRTSPALRDVSLDIAPGTLVAIVGPSGAGKSTLCSLVPRFHDPQEGMVRIDGHDLRELELASLSESTGLVFQETYLFNATLRHNLLYARPDAGEENLRQACAAAQLEGVIAGLPDGLETVVGERGYRLSGGEKQRVAIARVILKDPPILILDEATSHLDSLSEELVQRALDRLFRGRTSLVIAHRLSTVLAADRIVVLDRGQVVQEGTHHELLAREGLYRVLYTRQFTDRVPA